VVKLTVHGDLTDPPSNWCHWPVARLTNEIYYGWPEGETNPWFWHWCTARNIWDGAGTSGHQLVAREPLHLEPSLLWPCCDLHGWVHGNGEWTPA
jgi:hypothetical protein